MEMKDGPQGQSGPLDLITYCPRHAPLHPELSGVKIENDVEEDSFWKLINRQPYEQAMGISVPLPPSGCARSEVGTSLGRAIKFLFSRCGIG